MGQKVNPNGLRVGIIRDWESTWFVDKDYAKYVLLDDKIRKYFDKNHKDAFISKVKIKRIPTNNEVEVNILTARPGMVLGRDSETLKEIKKAIQKIEGKDVQISINVFEIENPELDAQIVAYQIAEQLLNRANFRIVQKKAIRNTMSAGAKGIKTKISGRLNGVDMARSEGYTQGNVPLHTIRADIDYALAEALTTYGQLGVKVWIYKGEILPTKESK